MATVSLVVISFDFFLITYGEDINPNPLPAKDLRSLYKQK